MSEQHSLADLEPIGLSELERLQRRRTKEHREVQRDTHYAERGERIALFLAGKPVPEVWMKDLLPIIERLYDGADEQLTPSTEDKVALIGYKQALKDLIEEFGGSVQLGRGAIRRIAARKFATRPEYRGA